MELYLQFGSRMLSLAEELLEDRKASGVILSPRDLEKEQIKRAANTALSYDAEVLVDPQCFERDSDHQRLTSYDYWKDFRAHATLDLVRGEGVDRVLEKLASWTMPIGIRSHILPAVMTNTIDDIWVAVQERFVERAERHFERDRVYATLALSSELVANEEQVELMVERVSRWPVHGVYLVAESPSRYVIESGTWLANLMILISGLRLAEKRVILGYANQQMLPMAAAGVTAVASGTWRNVRTFASDRFFEAEEKILTRATWYYCPQALSEYKLTSLDIAKRLGILPAMRAPELLGSKAADVLFGAAAPTDTGWGEPNAFRHFLLCLSAQARLATRESFSATVAHHRESVLAAQRLTDEWRSRRFVGDPDRDFASAAPATAGALAILEQARGAVLERAWPLLHGRGAPSEDW